MAAVALDRDARANRHLALAGAWGAALTLAIVGLSVLVRLATRIEAGEAVSLLPGVVEAGVRIAHRLAATGVAVAAAVALLGVLTPQRRDSRRVAALGAILVLTLLLASIGRYTPGYRIAAVTVANVVAGTLLASAFWWIREESHRSRWAGGAAAPVAAWAAFAALVALSAMGASASALASQGERDFGPAHLWVATLFLALSLTAAWRNRARRAPACAVAALAAFQYLAGFAILSHAAGAALSWVHAMGAAVLAPLLVSLAIRGQTPISHPETSAAVVSRGEIGV
jgi:hypothetical protein